MRSTHVFNLLENVLCFQSPFFSCLSLVSYFFFISQQLWNWNDIQKELSATTRRMEEDERTKKREEKYFLQVTKRKLFIAFIQISEKCQQSHDKVVKWGYLDSKDEKWIFLPFTAISTSTQHVVVVVVVYAMIRVRNVSTNRIWW